MGAVTIRPVKHNELAAWSRAIADAQGRDSDPSCVQRWLRHGDPDRALGAFDRGIPVGGTALQTRELTLPGGTVEPVAALLLTGVSPTHRRRGIFAELMTEQLAALHNNRREAIIVARAQDGPVPRRFGYGTAIRSRVMEAELSLMELSPDAPDGHGRVVLVEEGTARPMMEAVFEQARRGSVGWARRRPDHWDTLLADVAAPLPGVTGARIAVCLDAADRPIGYAVHRHRVAQDALGRDDSTLHLVESVSTRGDAQLCLWRYLLGLSGARMLRADGPVDEALGSLLARPRGVRWSVVDRLVARLVDVPRALAARRYAVDFDLSLRIHDDQCDWNDGIFRIQGDAHGADCARSRGAAQVELGVADLAGLLFGDSSLVALAQGGRVRSHDQGALERASVAFAGLRAPWCPGAETWPHH